MLSPSPTAVEPGDKKHDDGAPGAPTVAAIESSIESFAQTLGHGMADTARALWTARFTRMVTFAIALGILLVLTVTFEVDSPTLFWGGKRSTPIVFYDVSPGPQGEWELWCNTAKSPDGACTRWVKRYPLIVYGALSNRPWQDHEFFANPRAIISSMSELMSWAPYYEILRGLTLGAFDGHPMLAIVFQARPSFASSAGFNASAFGTPEQVAGMAYAVINEVHGHVGIGAADAEKLWETEDPRFPYACYRYWLGGHLVSPEETWGPRKCGGFKFGEYLQKYAAFRTTMMYILCSMLLALICAAYALWLTLRAVRRWKRSQVAIISRSPIFAAAIASVRECAEHRKVPFRELLVDQLPVIIYLECAITKLDGDPFNTLRPREGVACAVLQATYAFVVAAPLHIFAIFLSRPKTRTLDFQAFASAWSLPTYIILAHYTVQGIFVMLHYLKCSNVGWRYSAPGKVLFACYMLECRACILLSLFLLFLQLLWLCTAVAINPDYVIKLISVIGSILSLKFVALFTAEKFAKETERGFAQYENEAVALASVITKEMSSAASGMAKKAQELEKGAAHMAKVLDMHGKSIFWMFIGFALLLALAAVWVLLGTHLWGSNATQLTNLVMPAIVAALKVKADNAVTKVKQAAPKLVNVAEGVASGGSSLASEGFVEGGTAAVRQVMIDLAGKPDETTFAPEGVQLLKRIRTMGNLVAPGDQGVHA